MIFLLFFLVSAIFWMVQTLNENYETTLSVPLALNRVPSNIVITEELPSHLQVTLNDKGSVLLNYMYGQKLPPITVDYSIYSTDGTSGRVRIPPTDIQKELQPQLLSSTRITSIQPDTLEFCYNRGLKKVVPVRPSGYIETLPQYYLADMRCTPDSVVVYAPASVLDTMQAAYTATMHVEDLDTDRRLHVALRRSKGTKFVPETVNVDLSVDVYTEKTVEVPIIGVNFPASKDLRTFPSQAKVTFRIGAERFKSITAEDFVLAVSYEELLNNKAPTYRLHLRSLPPGVSQVRIDPAEVEYLIEQIAEE